MAQLALEQWIDLVGLPEDFFDFELSGTTAVSCRSRQQANCN